MRKVFLLLGTIFFSLAGIANTYSHSSVAKTTPQYKSTVSELPNQVSIEFSEEPLTISGEAINSITVTDPNGNIISDSVTEVSGKRLIVGISTTSREKGSYGVRYRMASGDGHVISGNYVFYLSHPSEKKTGNSEVNPKTEQWWGEHFFHVHRDHIIYAVSVVVIAVGILIWRRRAESR